MGCCKGLGIGRNVLDRDEQRRAAAQCSRRGRGIAPGRQPRAALVRGRCQQQQRRILPGFAVQGLGQAPGAARIRVGSCRGEAGQGLQSRLERRDAGQGVQCPLGDRQRRMRRQCTGDIDKLPGAQRRLR